MVTFPGAELDPQDDWDPDRCIELAVTRMRELQDHGVETFVDPCPIELGRDPELMLEVSRQSGMAIVCSTGFYHEHEAVGIPHYWRSRSAEEVAEFYLHEIANGIGQTGIRPGVIKMASGAPVTDHERRVMRGAAIAARASGLPVVTHTENSHGGSTQQDILEAEGVDLGRVLIGHQDRPASLDDLVAIAERGSFVGIDRIGLSLFASDDHRADLVAGLVAAGHASRVCLSQDHLCCVRAARPWFTIPEGKEQAWRRRRARNEEEMFGRSYTFLFTDFVPRLVERGVEVDVIESMLRQNAYELLIGRPTATVEG